jgi:hypothetical protein
MGLPVIVQYWRSFEHLEAFAKDAGDPHLAAWRNYGAGLGKAGRLVPVSESSTARGRLTVAERR